MFGAIGKLTPVLRIYSLNGSTVASERILKNSIFGRALRVIRWGNIADLVN